MLFIGLMNLNIGYCFLKTLLPVAVPGNRGSLMLCCIWILGFGRINPLISATHTCKTKIKNSEFFNMSLAILKFDPNSLRVPKCVRENTADHLFNPQRYHKSGSESSMIEVHWESLHLYKEHRDERNFLEEYSGPNISAKCNRDTDAFDWIWILGSVCMQIKLKGWLNH